MPHEFSHTPGEYDFSGSVHTSFMRMSAGYSLYKPKHHLIGIHYGRSMSVLRRCERDEQIIMTHPGSSLIVPADTVIESALSAPIDQLCLHLNPQYLDALAASIGSNDGLVMLCLVLTAHDARIYLIGEALLSEFQHPMVGTALYSDALYMQLGVHLLRHYRHDQTALPLLNQTVTAPQTTRRLAHAIAFIHEHLTDNLTLEQIAQTEHLSVFHFSRLFKQIYRVTPHQYLIRARVERAVEMLHDERLSVTDVALAVGFTSSAHLTRHFKKQKGAVPRK